MRCTSPTIANMPDAVVGEALVRLRGIRFLIDEQAEALFQPEWGPDGTLYFVSDRSGWALDT